MNIRDLEYVIALHKYGHFGKAAKSCFVSQPTLSGQFKKLEQELGVSLLERSTKGVVFSDAGLEIVERAKRVIAEVEQIQETARMMKDPRGGRMRLGIIPTICSFLLPHILTNLRKAFPKIRFSFHELKTTEIMDELDRGNLEAGILALPLEKDNLIEHSLYFENFLYAVSVKHPKHKLNKLSDEGMVGENILLLEEGHCFRHQALSICSKYAGSSGAQMNGTSLETLISMVSMGEGVTLVPELAALFWSSRKDVKFIPIENPVPQREIGLVFRKYSAKSDLFVEMSELIEKQIKGKLQKNRKQKEIIPVDL